MSWHRLSAMDVADRWGVTPDIGLREDEAARRLAGHGPNELRAAAGVSPWTILLAQLKNVLILVLLGATALSAFLGHGIEAAVIAFIVLLAVVLGFLQEYRAERALQALREMTAPTATVLRDGAERKIPARAVVPGDVLVLAAGDRVCADGRLVTAIRLEAEEAALTGESLPVDKTAAPQEGDPPLAERHGMVWAGTAITA
ncbi:MAG TPA: ATPase, partial [Acidobacteria bacterium]|nr:ATPase [Acidobacteriota bacterium]